MYKVILPPHIAQYRDGEAVACGVVQIHNPTVNQRIGISKIRFCMNYSNEVYFNAQNYWLDNASADPGIPTPPAGRIPTYRIPIGNAQSVRLQGYDDLPNLIEIKFERMIPSQTNFTSFTTPHENPSVRAIPTSFDSHIYRALLIPSSSNLDRDFTSQLRGIVSYDMKIDEYVGRMEGGNAEIKFSITMKDFKLRPLRLLPAIEVTLMVR